MGNRLLFPAPFSTYDSNTQSIKNNLVWIEEPEECDTKIPALWLFNNHPQTILYFHGNSTDLGEVREELEILRSAVNCNILAMEYPSYGVCQDVALSPELIDRWCLGSFFWLAKKLPHGSSGIILFGRSIGTGAAAKLAASLSERNVKVGGLILQSPFLSIHKIMKEFCFFAHFLSANFWDNERSLSIVQSKKVPLLIIHGLDDEIVPVLHGKELYEGYKVNKPLKTGVFQYGSGHNNYRPLEDIAVPISEFLHHLRKRKQRQLLPETRLSRGLSLTLLQ